MNKQQKGRKDSMQVVIVAPSTAAASSLSDLDGRSEKSHDRDQILPDLQRQ